VVRCFLQVRTEAGGIGLAGWSVSYIIECFEVWTGPAGRLRGEVLTIRRRDGSQRRASGKNVPERTKLVMFGGGVGDWGELGEGEGGRGEVVRMAVVLRRRGGRSLKSFVLDVR
jgi:hypothetical protein